MKTKSNFLIMLALALCMLCVETFSQPLPRGRRLKDIAVEKGLFYIGHQGTPTWDLNPQNGATGVWKTTANREYNICTWDIALKPDMEGSLGVYDFTAGDIGCAYGRDHNIVNHGHLLAGTDQYYANWFKNGTWTAAQLEAMLVNHIQTVMTRYKQGSSYGYIPVWDVINESVVAGQLDGGWAQCKWLAMGFDVDGIPLYISRAFEIAHQVDPTCLLFYNEGGNGIEYLSRQSDAVYNMIKKLKDRGVPIHGVGFQTHVAGNNAELTNLNSMGTNIDRFADLGLKILISELDVTIPDASAASYQIQADVYRKLLSICLSKKNDIYAFQTWGWNDGETWLPGTYCLPFDRLKTAKPAYYAMQSELENYTGAVIAVTGVTLNETTLTFVKNGPTSQLIPFVAPYNASNSRVSFTSSNSAIATVDANGWVNPVGTGTATITCTTASGNKTSTSAVTVNAAGSDNFIVRARVSTGVSADLQLLLNGAKVKTWTLSGSNYVDYSCSVSGVKNVKLNFPDGADLQVDFIKVGSIIYQAEDQVTNTSTWQNKQCGGSYSEFMVCGGYIDFGTIDAAAVYTPVTGITVSPATATLYPGFKQQLVASVLPAVATNKKVSWSSSNSNIVSVNNNGMAVAVATGTATITVTSLDNSNIIGTSTVTVNAIPAGQSPVGGTAWAIPGTIQAENYDFGGQNVAYFDSNVGNDGGGYRAEDVDLSLSGLENYAVGWAAAGEWLEYTVNVATAGSYKIDIQTAIKGTGKFRILFDGVDKTGIINVANSGGWVTWQTTTVASVNLVSGQQVMRFYFDGGFNIDKLTFTQNTTNVPVTGVLMNASSASLIIGATQQLIATVSPSNATTNNVTWSSNNAAIATVDNYGLISAIAPGTATIIVTTIEGNFTANCNVTVSNNGNYLANPGFEGVSSWGLGTHFSISTAAKRTGNSSLALTSGNGDYCTSSQTISVSANTDYTMSAWIKGSGKILFSIKKSDWTSNVKEEQFTATDSWTQCNMTFNSGSNTQISVVFMDNNTGTLFIDDASVSIGTVVTRIKENDNSTILLYPNPVVGGLVTIELNKALSNGSVCIFDFTGKKLLTKSIAGEQKQILNVSSLTKGLYLVKISDNTGVFVNMLIVK